MLLAFVGTAQPESLADFSCGSKVGGKRPTGVVELQISRNALVGEVRRGYRAAFRQYEQVDIHERHRTRTPMGSSLGGVAGLSLSPRPIEPTDRETAMAR